MSRLGANLGASPTGIRIAHMPSFSMSESYKPSSEYNVLEAYRVGATFERQVALDPKLSQMRAPAASSYVERAKLAILHEVFGEFIPLLREAQVAIMNVERDKALDLIDKVIHGFTSTEEVTL